MWTRLQDEEFVGDGFLLNPRPFEGAKYSTAPHIWMGTKMGSAHAPSVEICRPLALVA